jgi:hypothetical protein
VLVEDQTNVARDKDNQNTGYYAGVAKDKVRIYAQPKTNVPLLIDTDGNGICDEINFEALPQDQRPKPQQLSPLDPRGTSWFSKTVNFSEMTSDVSNWGATHGWSCEQDPNGPEDAPTPSSLCPKSDMTRVVAGEGEDHPPAVYALNPTNGTTGECEGGFWELYNDLSNYEGWVCLAARAEDTIGNIGVSAPLRVCLDNIDTPGTPCAGSKPTCLGGCTISAAQNFPANYVWFQP